MRYPLESCGDYARHPISAVVMPSFATLMLSSITIPRVQSRDSTLSARIVSISPLLTIGTLNMLDRISIKAGRSVRREGTRHVDPIVSYGYLILYVLSRDLYELSELISTG